MSRTLLILLAVAMMAASAAAQATGEPTLTIDGLPAATTVQNDTKESLPFQVTLTLPAGTCLGGNGLYTIALAAEQTAGANVTVEVNPRQLTFNAGQLGTATGAYTSTQSASLEVTAGVVAQATNVTVLVTGTLSGECPQGDVSEEAQAEATLSFRPVSALTQTGSEEPVPGFGLPLLAAALGAALLVARRKA